jgi:glycosyltransferase involved in cell wall biosynthesis
LKPTVEILYITWNRLPYTKLTLPLVLEGGGDVDYEVCITDNGSTDGTVEFLGSLNHPRIKRITLNEHNVGISPVTNEFWEKAESDYVGKVDNDILLPDRWLEPIMAVHAAGDPNVGVVGLTHFHRDEIDALDEHSYSHNIKTLGDGVKVFVQLHLGGACYAFPRKLFLKLGNADLHPEALTRGWSDKQQEFFRAGYFPCYVYPWITCKHLGDCRYPETDFDIDPPETEEACAERTRRHHAMLMDDVPGKEWDSLKREATSLRLSLSADFKRLRRGLSELQNRRRTGRGS